MRPAVERVAAYAILGAFYGAGLAAIYAGRHPPRHGDMDAWFEQMAVLFNLVGSVSAGAAVGAVAGALSRGAEGGPKDGGHHPLEG